MEILYFLIPLSICMSFMALIAFIWNVKSGQWSDLERHREDWIYEDKNKKEEEAK